MLSRLYIFTFLVSYYVFIKPLGISLETYHTFFRIGFIISLLVVIAELVTKCKKALKSL